VVTRENAALFVPQPLVSQQAGTELPFVAASKEGFCTVTTVEAWPAGARAMSEMPEASVAAAAIEAIVVRTSRVLLLCSRPHHLGSFVL
jgi:hypothetical protein